jgi:hypothetical protein
MRSRKGEIPVFFPVSSELPVTGLAANREPAEILLTIGHRSLRQGRDQNIYTAILGGLTKHGACGRWRALADLLRTA